MPFGGGNKEGYIGTWNIFWLLAGTTEAAFATGLGDGSVKFTDPIFHATCERVVRMYQDGWFPKGANSTPLFTDGANAFAKGEGAMLCGLVSDPLVGFPIMIKEFGEENVGVMPPVAVEGDRPFYIPAGAGEGWGIPTYTENAAAAWAFMEYVVQPEQQRAIFDEVGLVPANKKTSLEGAPQPLKDIVAEFDEYGDVPARAAPAGSDPGARHPDARRLRRRVHRSTTRSPSTALRKRPENVRVSGRCRIPC